MFKIYDNHEDPNPNVESLKLYCKVHQVPYFIILENDMLIYKIESDKDRLLFKQNSESEFHNFLKTKFNKSKESTAITPIKSNQTVHNVEDLNEDFQFVDILSSMKQLLSKFKKGPIHILLAEISKYMLKSIAAAIDISKGEKIYSENRPRHRFFDVQKQPQFKDEVFDSLYLISRLVFSRNSGFGHFQRPNNIAISVLVMTLN
ncbi:hypothetical protein HELRODRAFT_171443 [Helobdella robusta]|uniref:Uncharacterized protein n=1 Tax=Helobdella robusta TaxID=6412 RepID=T1F4A3_HELRO|nr:hypothetical protein HELRODRAFT_171443 [Helobdella robusta]ESO05773.1 hypothetical protein HELRODRAFT_171443 [Helobdella robusta]